MQKSLLPMTLLSGVLAMQGAALAQSGHHRMMVIEDDSGSGPQVLHFAGPDFGQVRQPDFVRRDLPIFRNELELDGIQNAIVGVLLEAYLDAFKLLVKEALPQEHFGMPGMDMAFGGGPDGEGIEGGEDIGAMIRDAIENADGFTNIDIDADGSGNVAVAIMMRAGDGPDMGDMDMGDAPVAVWAGSGPGGEGGDGEGPGAGVFIAVGGADGMELPEDVREKLEQIAQDMAERLQTRLAEAEANGVDLAGQFPEPPPMEDIEAHMQEMRKAMEQFVREKETLKQEFLTQVRSQLTAEQLGNWPSFDRALTRIKTLPDGRLDGERTDLLVLADDLDLNDEQLDAVVEQLETYELALDEALRERNKYLDDATKKIDEAIQDREFEKALSIVDSATRHRVAVRTVNSNHVDMIAEKLPADSATRFRRDALRQSYPRVYRRTAGQKSFQKARALPGLDEDALAGIAAIEADYEMQLAALNERIRETIHRYQPKETRQTIEHLAAMMSGEGVGLMQIGGHDDNDPIRAAFKKRKNLDERYMKQLHGTLSPEQVAQLPPLPSERKRSPFIIQRSMGSD
jgi:anion-transporting  ArsA/GET3 family ATPase